MTRVVFRIAILLLSIFSVGLLGPPVTAQPLYPTPDPDPFYAAPPNLAGLQPGDVVRARRIDSGPYAGTDDWQVAFRSTNSQGNPVMGVTTVLLPPGSRTRRWSPTRR